MTPLTLLSALAILSGDIPADPRTVEAAWRFTIEAGELFRLRIPRVWSQKEGPRTWSH